MVFMTERRRNGGIDEVPLPNGTAGRLWLCGKHYVGPDPEGTLTTTGAAAVVCLNEAYELAPRYPDYVEWLVANRVTRARWIPWPDMHAPPVDEFASIIAELCAMLDAGNGLVVHCGAGIGRAGTTGAALLMAYGVDHDNALRIVRAARPAAGPQTGEQDALLAAYATHLSESG